VQAYERELFAFVTVARGRLGASSSAVIPYAPRDPTYVRAVVLGRGGWSDGVSRPIVAGQ
jgi:hypothetical protein